MRKEAPRYGFIFDGENHGWFLTIRGWRQTVLLLLGLYFCFAAGVWAERAGVLP